MKQTLVIALIASTLVLTGCGVATKTNNTTMEKDAMMKNESMQKDDMMQKDEAMMKDDTMMVTWTTDTMKKDAMMKKDDTMMKDDKAMMQKSPAMYQDYSESAVAVALKEGKKVALFFHAPRCPSCRSLNKELTADITTLPANTVVFKTDYDSSSDLKKKYSVTSQHTIVTIDANMNKIALKKWWDAQDVASMLQ